MSEIEYQFATENESKASEKRDVLLNFYLKKRAVLLRFILKKGLGFSKEEAEDILQSAYLKTLEKINSVDEVRAYFEEVLTNIIKDIFRTDRRKNVSYPIYRSNVPTYKVPDQELTFAEKQLKEKLEAILRGINENHRQILHMYYVEEKSYEDIAKELGIEIGTVKSRLNRAKSALKDVLPPNFLEEIL